MLGKRILIGITGGIAAYKTPLLVRLLKKAGADVKCVTTPSAKDFVTTGVLSTLSENIVYDSFWDEDDKRWNNHVDLGIWADLFVIAPLTANTLSKMASGTCDNILLATYFSLRKKCIVFPAMDLDMYTHPSVSRNIEQISLDGVKVIPASTGELASGLSGQGRMPEPNEIFDQITNYFSSSSVFLEKKVLITAGPTYEPIDPVRFIGNHSSGKMGFAIANHFAEKGAKVTLVSGPSNQLAPHPNISLLKVFNAKEMMNMVEENWTKCDVGVFAAAVSDYRPKDVSDKKIKKNDQDLTIEMVKNPDILSWAGKHKTKEQKLIGFALETNNEEKNAKEKLIKKNLDAIVLNSLSDDGAGFSHDTNKVTIFDKKNSKIEYKLLSKDETAKNIVSFIEEMYL